MLWGLLEGNHLMMPVVVSVAEHFLCLKHKTHNGEILVVFVAICNQPTLKEIISLEQNWNECRALLTGKRERSTCPVGRIYARSANILQEYLLHKC
jgi:hypothetical protein